MKINVALPSSTISLSRSGFIRSSRCISLLLAAEHERTPFLFVPAADRFVFLVAKYCAEWLTGCSRTRMGSYCATYGRLCDPNPCIQRFALHSVYFATAKPTLENPDVGQDTPVELVMQPDPVTFRPHVPVGTLPEYVKTQRRRALVTTSDGVLIGLLRNEDMSEQRGRTSHHRASSME